MRHVPTAQVERVHRPAMARHNRNTLRRYVLGPARRTRPHMAALLRERVRAPGRGACVRPMPPLPHMQPPTTFLLARHLQPDPTQEVRAIAPPRVDLQAPRAHVVRRVNDPEDPPQHIHLGHRPGGLAGRARQHPRLRTHPQRLPRPLAIGRTQEADVGRADPPHPADAPPARRGDRPGLGLCVRPVLP